MATEEVDVGSELKGKICGAWKLLFSCAVQVQVQVQVQFKCRMFEVFSV